MSQKIKIMISNDFMTRYIIQLLFIPLILAACNGITVDPIKKEAASTLERNQPTITSDSVGLVRISPAWTPIRSTEPTDSYPGPLQPTNLPLPHYGAINHCELSLVLDVIEYHVLNLSPSLFDPDDFLYSKHVCAMSPDGTQVAIGLNDNTIGVWSIDNRTKENLWSRSGEDFNTEPKILSGHTDKIHALTFSSDGRILASGSRDTKVGLWGMDQTHPTGTFLSGHLYGVLTVAFSPDGTQLVTGGHDIWIGLWDLTKSQPSVFRLQGHHHAVTALDISDDGTLLASYDQLGNLLVRPLDIQTIDPEYISHSVNAPNFPGFISFLPDDNTKISAGGGSWQAVIDLQVTSAAFPEIPFIKTIGEQASTVTFTPDGNKLVLTHEGNRIWVWDLVSNPTSSKELVWNGFGPRGVDITTDGTRMVTLSKDYGIAIWDMTQSNPQPFQLPDEHFMSSYDAAFLEDEDFVVAAVDDSALRLYDLNNPLLLPTQIATHPGAGVLSLATSPDNSTLASLDSKDFISVWSISGNSIDPMPKILKSEEKRAAAITLSNDFLVVSYIGLPGEVILYNYKDWDDDPIRLQPANQGDITVLAASPDGRMIATGDTDGNLAIWNIDNPEVPPIVTTANIGGVYGLSFSPDSKIIATAGIDKAVRLWPTSAEVPDYVCQLLDPTLGPTYWEQQSLPPISHRLKPVHVGVSARTAFIPAVRHN